MVSGGGDGEVVWVYGGCVYECVGVCGFVGVCGGVYFV